jgi:putative methionine-R-sulfoxide reductase with GAF domain
MKVFRLGVDDTYPEFLQRKIIISNMIAVILAVLVALPFVFISLIFFPPLAYLPIIAIPIALSTLLFNYARLHTVARLVISFVPVCLAAIYQAYLSKSGAAVTPGLAMIMLSFSFIVFVIFDLREKGMLTITSLVMVLIMVSMDWLNDALEMDLDTAVIETGFLAKLVVVIGIISGAGCILILVLQNKEAEAKAFDLVKAAEESKRAITAQEQALKENLNKLEASQKEERERQWANEGLAKCISIIRNQQDSKVLGNELISFIVKYLNANQGGLFLLNDDNPDQPFLQLVAAYAYERKKYLQKRVELGEGLLGQAFLEKEYVYLTRVPKEYVNITSGLGEATPTTLLLVPLQFNEQVIGIIELASFHEFSEFQIGFVEQLGENIASNFQTIKTNEKTRTLLEVSQQQTEEMKSQEEEMRQNMEELSATQEEMSRKEQEYLSKIKELENKLTLSRP